MTWQIDTKTRPNAPAKIGGRFAVHKNLDFSRLRSLRNQIRMRSLVPRERNNVVSNLTLYQKWVKEWPTRTNGKRNKFLCWFVEIFMSSYAACEKLVNLWVKSWFLNKGIIGCFKRRAVPSGNIYWLLLSGKEITNFTRNSEMHFQKALFKSEEKDKQKASGN